MHSTSNFKAPQTRDRIAFRCSPQPKPNHGAQGSDADMARLQGESSTENGTVAKAQSRVRVVVESFAVQPRDIDNICVKAVIDEFRYAGLLIEDDPDHMELFIRSNRVSKREHERIIFTLEII